MTRGDSVRAWLAPPPGASLPGIDLAALDPADEDDRALLVRAQHPDLATAVDQARDEVELDGEPINPRLHLLIHEVVAAQLWSDDPPEARRAAERLLAAGYDRHEALHLIGAVVTDELWTAQFAGAPAETGRYVAALEALGSDELDGLERPGPQDLDLGDLDLDAGDMEVTDEEEFDETRDWLLDAHRAWLADGGLPDEDWVAHQLLHHKLSYLDGHLGRWQAEDLREILLDLFPRKVVVEEQDLDDVVPAVDRFLGFLADAGLLDERSDPLPRLSEELQRLAPPFLDRMRDPAEYSPGKALFTGMIDAGVDPEDPDEIAAWMEEFNALPDDERARLLPGPTDARSLPHMVVPDDVTLAGAALETPAMRQMAAFLDWVGDGRRLTQKGNLKLADGKALIGLLGTTDRFDETIGDRSFKTHSTTDLPGVDLVFRLALRTRLARRHKGRLVRTTRGARLADDPLPAWRGLVDAMVDVGLITAGREDRYGLQWWAPYVEEGAVELLAAVAEVGAAVPIEALAEAAHEGLDGAYDLTSLSDVGRRGLPDSVAWGVGTMVDRLVWLGAATREGVVVTPDRWGSERRAGGELGLTDLGRWYVQPLLLARGHEIPKAGALVDAPADELLAAMVDWPLDAVHAEVQRWTAGRATAVDELVTAARQAHEPDVRALAFEALEVIGDETVPAVRALVDEPDLRPWALAWLIARGDEQPEAFGTADAAGGLVQALAMALVTGGPEAVAEMLASDMSPQEQIAMVEHLWNVDDPYTAPVLDALAESADGKLAKAARKALFRHRSAHPAGRDDRGR